MEGIFDELPQYLEHTSSPADRSMIKLALLQRELIRHEISSDQDEDDCDGVPEPFDYRKLPPRTIRLLKIYPYMTSPYEPLVISLHVVDPEHDVPFDALSYTWGPPTVEEKERDAAQIFTRVPRCYPVYCGAKLLHVTRNLRDALVNLRGWRSTSQDQQLFQSMMKTSLAPHVWIDELCINQDDVHERNQQISFMGQIYSRAKLVLAWLGGHDNRSRRGFHVLNQLVRLGAAARKTGESVTPQSFHDESFWQRCGIAPLSTEQWYNLTELLCREWFTRTWVIQEIALVAKPAICLCGTTALEADAFLNVLPYITLWSADICAPLRERYSPSRFDFITRTLLAHPFTLIYNIKHGLKQGKGFPFLSLQAYTYPATHCSDPRDKIYASLAIADEFSAGFVADYNEQVSATYIRASRQHLEASRSLDFLSITAHPHQKAPDTITQQLPSWCPNYSSLDRYDGRPSPLDFQPDLSRCPKIFNATKGSVHVPTESPATSPLLPVKGKFCGRILRIANTSASACEWEGLSERLDVLLQLELPPGQSLAEIFWRTLIHNMYDSQRDQRQYGPSGEISAYFLVLFYITLLQPELLTGQNMTAEQQHQYRALASKITHLREKDPNARALFPDIEHYLSLNPEILADGSFQEEDILALPEDYMEFVSLTPKIKAREAHRRMFCTSDQRLGMGFETMRAGDEVWLLAGGYVPYVLRPLGQGRFGFVGEAYVHGIMMGEDWAGDEGELVDIVLE